MNTMTQRYFGIVREFDRTRGYGTIQVDNGECVFVRYSAILGEGLRTLQSGDRVSFDVEHGSNKVNAVRVIRC